MTKQRYIELMQHMFQSGGWREAFKPALQAIRQGHVDQMCYSCNSLEDLRGAQHGLSILDQVLGIEEAVARLAEEIAEQPEEAVNPVE